MTHPKPIVATSVTMSGLVACGARAGCRGAAGAQDPAHLVQGGGRPEEVLERRLGDMTSNEFVLERHIRHVAALELDPTMLGGDLDHRRADVEAGHGEPGQPG